MLLGVAEDDSVLLGVPVLVAELDGVDDGEAVLVLLGVGGVSVTLML